jgi:hypothetical protein
VAVFQIIIYFTLENFLTSEIGKKVLEAAGRPIQSVLSESYGLVIPFDDEVERDHC